MNRKEIGQHITHLLMAVGISGLLIALLIHSSLASIEGGFLPGLISVITAIPPVCIVFFLLASFLRTILQTIRYRLILQTSESDIPRFFHVFLVTVSRNMFVDMLPSRLGELSYIAMLNKGYNVRMQSCISSLVISFAFDLFALALLIAGILVYQFLAMGVELWVLGTLILVSFVFVLLLFFLFPGLNWAAKLVARISIGTKGFWGRMLVRLATFLVDLVAVLQKTREAGIIGRLVLLSLGVRAGKYFGLYALFIGVTAHSYPEVSTNFASTLIALISAEAGASLPLPTFMGFGTYEAAGILAMVALGADRAASLLIMLSLHIVTQVIDYLCGSIALIIFVISTRSKVLAKRTGQGSRFPWFVITTLLLVAVGAIFLLYELRKIRNLGSLRPPQPGQILIHSENTGQGLDDLTGFVIWSSNRSGNHNLWRYSLPDGEIQQLTTHPHAEFFPRISPNGSQVLFSRSKEPWVSQRNNFGWDVFLLDLRTGKERMVAQSGKWATWSFDGRQVYFQRNGNELVQLELASGRETVLLQSGRDAGLDASVILSSPVVSPKGTIALALDGRRRGTLVISTDGEVRSAGSGCQLNWGPGFSYLYKVDHGGVQKNAIYRMDRNTLKPEIWFDAPRPFSYEYFPKVSNTGDILVYGASQGAHEHDTADYEIFLWRIGSPSEETIRLTYHTGNDCWPDIFLAD